MNNYTEVRAHKVRPLAVVAALFAAAIVGNALIVGCGGNKAQQSNETTTPPPASTESASPGGATAGSEAELGKKVYMDRCALCHGPEGKGDGTAAAGLDPKPRNHTDGAYMNARTNEELMTVVRNGKGAMPAWGSILSDAEIKAVLTYVRTLAQPPYTGPMP